MSKRTHRLFMFYVINNWVLLCAISIDRSVVTRPDSVVEHGSFNFAYIDILHITVSDVK